MSLLTLISPFNSLSPDDNHEAFHRRMDDFERRLQHLSDVVEVIRRQTDDPPAEGQEGH